MLVTSTLAQLHEDLNIDSDMDVGLVAGCALVDWRFDCGQCSFPGIWTHPRSSAHQLHRATVDVCIFLLLSICVQIAEYLVL